MAFCTHCGAPLPDGAKFCTSCGTPIAAKPSVNPAPQPQAPPQQAPQPQTPQYNQPVQARPTPQGIVIDAPEGATVTVSDDVPQQEASAEAPAGKGEFVVASWSAPKAPKPQVQAQAPAAPKQPQYQQPAYQQPPQYQQPQYPQQPYQQAPQYPRQPQYPPQQPYQQTPAPAPEKKKKRSIWGWIAIILVGLVFLAMKLGW